MKTYYADIYDIKEGKRNNIYAGAYVSANTLSSPSLLVKLLKDVGLLNRTARVRDIVKKGWYERKMYNCYIFRKRDDKWIADIRFIEVE